VIASVAAILFPRENGGQRRAVLTSADVTAVVALDGEVWCLAALEVRSGPCSTNVPN
jgi:hypothetical protein